MRGARATGQPPCSIEPAKPLPSRSLHLGSGQPRSLDRKGAKMHSPDCALLRRHSHVQALSSGLHARCPSLRQLTHTGSLRHCPAQKTPQLFQPRAAITATPASLDVKDFDGSAAGSAELSLKVAPPPTAKGLVHRYVTYVLQNARAVSRATGVTAFIVLS